MTKCAIKKEEHPKLSLKLFLSILRFFIILLIFEMYSDGCFFNSQGWTTQQIRIRAQITSGSFQPGTNTNFDCCENCLKYSWFISVLDWSWLTIRCFFRLIQLWRRIQTSNYFSLQLPIFSAFTVIFCLCYLCCFLAVRFYLLDSSWFYLAWHSHWISLSLKNFGKVSCTKRWQWQEEMQVREYSLLSLKIIYDSIIYDSIIYDEIQFMTQRADTKN